MKNEKPLRARQGLEEKTSETNLRVDSTVGRSRSQVNNKTKHKLSAEEFLGLVWPERLLRHETLELRAILRPDGSIRREFARSIPDFLKLAEKYRATHDVYFGVATRFRNGGKKNDCYRVCTVWADFDHKKLQDCKNLQPQPNIVVSSGGGVHAYWLLDRTFLVRVDDRWRQIEAINRSLAKKFGSDINTIDITRILRVPGFSNHKYDPVRPVEAFYAS